MALATDKSLFLHIPKTGGIWIRHVFKVCGIPYYEISDQHAHFPHLLNYQSEQFYKDHYIFTFIRHPLTWYQSRWAFRVKHGWRAQHPLDFNCASNDFHVFIENVLNYKPNGWVTWEYLNYIDLAPKIDFVGKMENLVDDTIYALRSAGEKFSENAVRSIPRINDSDMDGKSSKYWAIYTLELANRVMAVESEIIRRYYYNTNFNPNILCGPCPY